MFRSGVLLLCFLPAAVPVLARGVNDSLNATGMAEVVVTGQYAPIAAERAVQPLRVISRAQIDAMAAQNLRDVLTNEQSVRLSQDNILGSSLSLQGVSGQNIKYLLDGVPIVGRQGGDIDLTQINLANVERIEIVRGPMSVAYGNNALGGTINLITRKTVRPGVEGGVTAYWESIGTYNLTGRAGLRAGAHGLVLSGGRNFFDGWSSGDPVSLDFSARPADARRVQQWKPREQYFGDLTYTYRRDWGTLQWHSALFRETILNRGEPRAPYGETASDDRYATARFDNAVFFNTTVLPNRALNVQVAYNDYRRVKNTFFRDLTTMGSELSANPGAQDTAGFTLLSSRGTLATTNGDRDLNYELGYDVNLETAIGARILDGRQQIGDYALFFTAEYKPVKGLVLKPGLRAAYNTKYDAPLTPALNLRWELTPAVTLRASYAKGFRAPDLKELYFYFVDVNHNIRGNSGLVAERSDNYHVALAYAAQTGRWRWRVEGAGFYNDIRNRIALALVSGTEYAYANVSRYRTQGGEVTASLTGRNASFSVGGGYTGFYNGLAESEGVSVPPFSYSPEVRGSMQYTFGATGWSAAVFYKYTGRLPGYALDASERVVETSTAGYSMADFTASKELWGRRLRLSAGAKNLFDVTTIAAAMQGGAHSAGGSTVPMSTGRNYFFKVDYLFRSRP